MVALLKRESKVAGAFGIPALVAVLAAAAHPIAAGAGLLALAGVPQAVLAAALAGPVPKVRHDAHLRGRCLLLLLLQSHQIT